MIEFKLPPSPPKNIPYPRYTQQEKDEALLAVIKFVLSIPESRLRPEAQKMEGADNEQQTPTAG